LKLHRAALASRLLIPTQTLIVTLSLKQNKTMSHQENRLVAFVSCGGNDVMLLFGGGWKTQIVMNETVWGGPCGRHSHLMG
jgi:hypothetical protein